MVGFTTFGIVKLGSGLSRKSLWTLFLVDFYSGFGIQLYFGHFSVCYGIFRSIGVLVWVHQRVLQCVHGYRSVYMVWIACSFTFDPHVLELFQMHNFSLWSSRGWFVVHLCIFLVMLGKQQLCFSVGHFTVFCWTSSVVEFLLQL